MVDRAELIAAFEDSRERGDVNAMAAAALGLAEQRAFGGPAGRAPAFLHEAYLRSSGSLRIRLAVALTRSWVYANEPERAVPFAAEAVSDANRLGDSALLADALDAALLVRWGADDLADRLALTIRLDDVVAHLPDPEARLSSHLWRLTTALENLDLPTAQRQLRALDELAAETGSARMRMFADARRCMYALLTGDEATAAALIDRAVQAGEQAGEADAAALSHELSAQLARQRGDLTALATEAESFEDFGQANGVLAIVAEAAGYWLAAGHRSHARRLLDQLVGPGLSSVPRNLDWLMVVCIATEVAAATDAPAIAAEGIDLLTPYAGRAVLNAGAVTVVGVVDDYLRLGCAAIGRHEEAAQWTGRARAAYQRLGASWWLTRLAAWDAAEPAGGSAGGSGGGGSGGGGSGGGGSAGGGSAGGGSAGGGSGGGGSAGGGSAGGGSAGGGSAGGGSAGGGSAAGGSAPSGDLARTDSPPSGQLGHLVLGPGGICTVGRNGHVTAVREVKGFGYLRVLLTRPGVDVPAVDLVAALAGGAVDSPPVGEVLDRAALLAYRRRLAALDQELAQATDWADVGRVGRLVDERDALISELASATGLGGRRRSTGGTAERARVAVQKALVAAIRRIGEVDPVLGRLLTDTVRTGTNCSYQPDPSRPMRWVLR